MTVKANNSKLSKSLLKRIKIHNIVIPKTTKHEKWLGQEDKSMNERICTLKMALEKAFTVFPQWQRRVAPKIQIHRGRGVW